MTHLGIRYSYPDWIVDLWRQQVGLEEAEQLCQWFNQPPSIDLRVNPPADVDGRSTGSV